MRPIILIVDDEPNVRLTYRAALETEGLEVREAADGIEALRLMRETACNLAILDMRMPEVSGLELLERMRQAGDSDAGCDHHRLRGHPARSPRHEARRHRFP